MNKIDIPKEPELAGKVIESNLKLREMDLRSGFLGKIFGSGPHTLTHVVTLIALLLVLAGIAYTFIPMNEGQFPPGDFWKTIAPMITGLLGFLFGTRHNS